MSKAINPSPELPPEIENAARAGQLVVFVGAGISKLINCPSWDGFADKVLEQLIPKGIDYYELSQIKGIADPKKRLSIAKIVARKREIPIDYPSIFDVEQKGESVYTHLNSFNSSFVTTNYEKYLRPKSRSAQPEDTWRYYRRDQLLSSHLDAKGAVIHLHGCVDDPGSMIFTTKDYLEHYSRSEVRVFLRELFERKTVLFLGYGLDELEVLEYILRRGEVDGRLSGGEVVRRYMLQGFFQAEQSLCDLLTEYYLESFGTQLIGFPKDKKSYAHQTEILALWGQRLSFGDVELADEAVLLRGEING